MGNITRSLSEGGGQTTQNEQMFYVLFGMWQDIQMLKQAFDAHTHGGITTGAGTSGAPTTTSSALTTTVDGER